MLRKAKTNVTKKLTAPPDVDGKSTKGKQLLLKNDEYGDRIRKWDLIRASKKSMEEFIQTLPRKELAKMLYLASGGKISNRAICEQLQATEKEVSRWKRYNKWDQALLEMKTQTADLVASNLATSIGLPNNEAKQPREYGGFEITDEFVLALNSVFSGSASALISKVITDFHIQDLKHIKMINSHITRQLEKESLHPVQIARIVEAKKNIIDMIRTIFNLNGKETPQSTVNNYIELTLNDTQLESLKLSDSLNSIVDAEVVDEKS